MADDHATATHHEAEDRTGLSGLTWVLLAIAVLLMVGGLAMGGYARFATSDTPQSHATPLVGSEDGGSGLLPGDLTSSLGPTGASGSPESAASSDPSGSSDGSVWEEWSPTVFRLGFSFFVGFAMAYALRAFLRVTITSIGMALVLLFGLQYAQIIDVRWALLEGHYDSVMSWLSGQVAGFKAFVQGYLPSAASGGAGFLAGLRRR